MSVLSSLSNRIFLASALLTVLSIGVAVFVINRTATARAEEDLERSLEEAGTLVEQFQSLLFEHLVREARLIADLPKLKAAVSVDHEPTVRPLAADYRRQIDADLFLVTNRQGVTLGLAHDLGLPPDAVANFEGTARAKAGHEDVTFWPRPEALLQVVSVPIYLDPAQPEILGTLTAGVSLDRRLATRIKALTRTEVVFGSQGVIHASTLSDEYRASLAPLLTTPGVSHIVVGGEEFVAVRRLLALGPAQRGVAPGAPGSDNTGGIGIGAAARGQSSAPGPPLSAGIGGGGAPVDATHAPVAVILRSRSEHLRFLRTLHTALGLSALAAVIGATVLSFAVARTITRPLGGLIATMREMAKTGDLTRGQPPSVPASRWEDEDARVLTTTFRALTASLGRFQHEAAQRERLSSLGRLSTVVAHEIRNPLMIIKASLRTLRRDASHLPDAAEAIGDIEEEVARLNALVNEVLDYAKPIRFDYGAVDLNALCRAAATAASAGQPGRGVRLFEEARVGEIVTDAERLRLVLINVLTNAYDAVLEREGDAGSGAPLSPGAAPATPATPAAQATKATKAAPAALAALAGPSGLTPTDIDLRTDCPSADVVRITVTDRGQGIASEHLARIFDPFFTTKRTGSGLGLAIAKNIVEGLGGTIAIASQPSRGTTVRITLPREAPRDRRQAGVA